MAAWMIRVTLTALVAVAIIGAPHLRSAEAGGIRLRRSLMPGAKHKASWRSSSLSRYTKPKPQHATRRGDRLRRRKASRADDKEKSVSERSKSAASKQPVLATKKAPQRKPPIRNKAKPTSRLPPKGGRTKPRIRRDRVKVTRKLLTLFRKIGRAPKVDAVNAQLLESDADALEARLDLISKAKVEINLSAFILTPDRVGLMVLARLRDAARRGVKVRLMIDALGSSKIPPGMLHHLASEGIEIRKYNEPTFRKLRSLLGISRRMHDKLLIVDGRAMVLGARNLDEGYFGGKKPGYAKFVNTDAFIEGESAAKASRYFLEVWRSKQVTRHRNSSSFHPREAKSRASLDHWAAVLTRRPKRLYQRGWRSRAQVVGLGRFVHDPTDSLLAKGGVHHEILNLLDSAKSSIDIQTPYLVPTRKMLRALRKAGRRGVKVTIYTNSLKTIDSKLAQLAYEGQLGRLAETGARIFEYNDSIGMHSKGVTVDERYSYIGSYNFDPRSAVLNKEVGMIVDSPAFARQMLEHSSKLRQRSIAVADQGRLTELKHKSCGIGCRSIAAVLAPLLRLTGIYSQL